jgi:hypothetical protein
MLAHDDKSIHFAEWAYLGKGKYQRRDFQLETLTQSSAFSREGDIFAELGRHEIFIPIKDYSPMTITELASAVMDGALKGTHV